MDGTCTPRHLAPTDTLKGQLGITAEEEAKAFLTMEEACFSVALDPSHPDYWRDVAWCLAVDALRQKKRGPKKHWSKTERLALVATIEKELREWPAAKREFKVKDITERLRSELRWQMASGYLKVDDQGKPVTTKANGAGRSGLTAKALERVYEDTKPEWDRLEKLAQARGESLLNDGSALGI
jgi:hypothetical protein